jgi:hypothetical protein
MWVGRAMGKVALGSKEWGPMKEGDRVDDVGEKPPAMRLRKRH